jgi:hypothetical protein
MSIEILQRVEQILNQPSQILTMRAKFGPFTVGIANYFKGDDATAFVCVHPSSKTYDGEFRKGIIPLAQFNHFYAKYDEYTSHLEEACTALIASKLLEFYTISNGIKLGGQKGENQRLSPGENQRLPVRALVVNLLVNIDAVKNHYLPNYYNPEHIKLLELLYETIKMPIINLTKQERIYNDFTVLKEDYTKQVDEIYCVCQKISPLTAYAYKHKHFEEMTVSTRIKQFIISARKDDNFSYMFGIAEMQNVSREFYENTSIRDKFKNSDTAARIWAELGKINESSYADSTLKRFINTFFKDLAHKLEDARFFIESNMIFTDHALCVYTNFMGRTVGDVKIAHRLITDGIAIPRGLEPHISIFTTEARFSACIKQILINLAHLEYLDVFHGDFHLNNITIRPTTEEMQEVEITDNVNTHTIKVATHGFRIGLIDFSRGIDFQLTSMSKVIAIDTIHYYIDKIDAKFYESHKAKLGEMVFARLFSIARLFDFLFILKSFTHLFDEGDLNMTLVDGRIKAALHAEISSIKSYIQHVLTQPGDKHVYYRYLVNHNANYE